MALTMKDVQADRNTLKGNYLFENRYAIIKWAKDNGQDFLTFTAKADAYAHFNGQTNQYKASIDEFNKIRRKYETANKGEKVGMGDILA